MNQLLTRNPWHFWRKKRRMMPLRTTISLIAYARYPHHTPPRISPPTSASQPTISLQKSSPRASKITHRYSSSDLS
ncbi:hypothetical protein I7I53_02928 [Histoplasma capsulatum var. duboisii H88]|uniref:Uncharacterized protein n=2 Tax=Ajellomyces capsulatus TaxID=5037 RepID=A0A8H7Z0E6_AJECA|nr:hypothetical protein I7I52_09034 [Histoplasma capsulatum]QSS55132.1 hypothetical protein I7I53_02928 [Histoplasma capsulatum var. duboisii H88]QSS73103.1 hypothetical protein I7I50_01142 [Histoplasma capsulatum G186AR]